MKIAVRHSCTDFDSYRAARVKSLFNVETGANFALDAELPLEGTDWQLGVVVGPSGSGKSSLGARLWPGVAPYAPEWPARKPIVDAIQPGGDFNTVTAALAAVGLGNVPTWLRPYRVLSNGEKFRADLARVVCEAPARVVLDEFSSVVDRQIAKIGAGAFAKAWRRTGGQAVLLTCHYDVLDWLQPDWIFDTSTGVFTGRPLRRRPGIELAIHQTDWRYWPLFEPHHYLKLPRMVASFCYVGTVAGEPVAHVAFATRPGLVEARACRLVIMPEWQGAGVGLRFLDAVCEEWRQGRNPYGVRVPTLFHTSHPGLAAALRRSRSWTQVSGRLCGENKLRCAQSLLKSAAKGRNLATGPASGYGGHFRAVQGFRYLGGEA